MLRSVLDFTSTACNDPLPLVVFFLLAWPIMTMAQTRNQLPSTGCKSKSCPDAQYRPCSVHASLQETANETWGTGKRDTTPKSLRLWLGPLGLKRQLLKTMVVCERMAGAVDKKQALPPPFEIRCSSLDALCFRLFFFFLFLFF